MFFFIVCFYILFIFIYNKTNKALRLSLLNLTLILSVFFFASKDPFIGIPLYFYTMLLSIVFSIKKINKVSKSQVYLSVFLLVSIIFQLFFVILQYDLMPVLLINKSCTDVTNINEQLYYPTFNFTVFKHFVFFELYILFLLLNKDLINTKKFYIRFEHNFLLLFKVLFVAIIVESFLVNLTNFNDRHLMEILFNVSSNQKENWVTFGIQSVCLGFTERSSMSIVLLYYLLILKKTVKGNDKLWLLISFVAVFCTGSSSALCISLLFLAIIGAKNCIKSTKKYSVLTFALCFVALFVVIINSLNSDLFFKISEYFNPTIAYGSAFYRRRSNDLALLAISHSPLIGMGIGTVYSHSLLLQSLANIGIIGVGLTTKINFLCLNQKNNKKNWLLGTLILCIFSFTFMIQDFTSPFFISLIICAFYKPDRNRLGSYNYRQMSIKGNNNENKKHRRIDYIN